MFMFVSGHRKHNVLRFEPIKNSEKRRMGSMGMTFALIFVKFCSLTFVFS